MYSSNIEDREKLALEIHDACTKVGFMQIKNHGINWSIVERTFAAMKDFFALPLETKMSVHQQRNPHFHSYEPLYETNLDKLKRGDSREACSWGYEPENDPESIPSPPEILIRSSIWPEAAVLPGLKEKLLPYQQALVIFARKFLRISALALDLPGDYFDKKVDYPMAAIRALHYPPKTAPGDEETSLGAHTDIEFFTIIAQTITDYPALEVLSADSEWIKVFPKLECFVVNLAAMMMRMTNDGFVSTVHRVVNKGSVDRLFTAVLLWRESE